MVVESGGTNGARTLNVVSPSAQPIVRSIYNEYMGPTIVNQLKLQLSVLYGVGYRVG